MAQSLPRSALVTGAAGFIGSHLADRLIESDMDVVGLDNLSSGYRSNLRDVAQNRRFRLIEGDLLDAQMTRRALGDSTLIFHLAADPEVRIGAQTPESHFRQNLSATFSLLEMIRERATPTRLVFASTSTVYGEASVIPTPEDYGPLLPISTYGATKLGCEGLAASYTELTPLHVAIFRFANIVGSRAQHGVIHDFILKLLKNPRELEVLGDGTQTKSYLHVDDCIDALMMALHDQFWSRSVDVFNIGSDDQTNVLDIARMVIDAMGLKSVGIRTTAERGRRAWPGDVATMQLDTLKIKSLGWKAKRNSGEAVRTAVDELLPEVRSKQTV